MDTKKGWGQRSSGTGRFVTITPRGATAPMTKDGVNRVHEALSKAAEQTGEFKSSSSGQYGARKLPPKSK